MSAMATPYAESAPGVVGASTRVMPSPSASSQACCGPAPPKATSVNSRGSKPRSSEIARTARSIVAFTTRTTPSAAASTSAPIASASRASADRAAPRSSGIRPPRKSSARMRPSTRLASVTVAASPTP